MRARPGRDARRRCAAHEARSSVFPGNLANLFIVSEVRLEPAEAPLEVRVEHAAGAQVRALLDVVRPRRDVPSHPGVCERCDDVLGPQ